MGGIKKDRTILVVEDTPEDFELTVRALRKAGVENAIVNCCDGDDALDYLYFRGKYAPPGAASRPGLILLDLNLPGTDGRQVLEQIKRDDNLRSIPVIVLTTSSDRRDVGTCYQSGANSFIQKPVGLNELHKIMERLKEYWLEVVILDSEEQ